MIVLLSIAFGALVGFALGLTGGGGSLLAVPLLVYGLAIPAREAFGISLAAVGTTALIGVVPRLWRGLVEVPTGFLFALAGMVGAPLGTYVAAGIPEPVLLASFSLLMLLVAAKMWSSAAPENPDKPTGQDSARGDSPQGEPALPGGEGAPGDGEGRAAVDGGAPLPTPDLPSCCCSNHQRPEPALSPPRGAVGKRADFPAREFPRGVTEMARDSVPPLTPDTQPILQPPPRRPQQSVTQQSVAEQSVAEQRLERGSAAPLAERPTDGGPTSASGQHLEHEPIAQREAGVPRGAEPAGSRRRWSWRFLALLGGMGLLTGFLSGMFGVGGGFVIVPALVLVGRMPIHRAVATSLLVIVLVSISGVASHFVAGRGVPLALTAWFVVGGTLGLWAGGFVAAKLSGPRLQQIFAAGIVVVALAILTQALL